MAAPLLHHRSKQFQLQLARTRNQLQQIFQTAEPVLILTSSGTGAMEAAIASLAGEHEKTLAVVAGKFGERWQQLCLRHEVECAALRREHGQAATPAEVAKAAVNEQATMVLLQGCETSTATSFDIEGIARELRRKCPAALIVVDAITALAAQPFEMDAWGLDVVISGGQKGFAAPPGLAFVALSQRAQDRLEKTRSRSYYLDLKRELAGQPDGRTAYTPAVTLVAAVDAATRAILNEGLEHVIAEAALMAHATRAALSSLGFELLSDRPSNAVTAAFPPPGVDAEQLRKSLDDSLGLKVAGGQGPLKGRIIRIAHLGYFDALDVMTVIGAIELTLAELGHTTHQGQGVVAALARLQGRENTCAAS